MLDTRPFPEGGSDHRQNAVASHDAAEPVLDLLRLCGILLRVISIPAWSSPTVTADRNSRSAGTFPIQFNNPS